MPQGGFGNGHGVFLLPLGEHVGSDALALTSSWSMAAVVDITGHQQGLPCLLKVQRRRWRVF